MNTAEFSSDSLHFLSCGAQSLPIAVLTQQICPGPSAALKNNEQFRIQSDPTSAGRVHLQTRAVRSRPASEMEFNTNAALLRT